MNTHPTKQCKVPGCKAKRYCTSKKRNRYAVRCYTHYRQHVRECFLKREAENKAEYAGNPIVNHFLTKPIVNRAHT